MSNQNQLHYFASQTYRQVQLSIAKGAELYSYSNFTQQFNALLDASGNEAHARHLTIKLVEEAAKYHETTDYLRREMAFETKVATLGDREEAIQQDKDSQDDELTSRRWNRQEAELMYS